MSYSQEYRSVCSFIGKGCYIVSKKNNSVDFSSSYKRGTIEDAIDVLCVSYFEYLFEGKKKEQQKHPLQTVATIYLKKSEQESHFIPFNTRNTVKQRHISYFFSLL